MSRIIEVSVSRSIAAWLEHLRDLGVEGLRETSPRGSSRQTAPAKSTSVPSPPASLVHHDAALRRALAAAGLSAIREEIGDCKRCQLSAGRTRIVYGVGNPCAELMFVGEAPGHDEDLQGEPFVGKAGQLLTRIIEAMGFKREDVYIANIVKCRPPGNRLPETDEVATCLGFLLRQIDAIHPRIIVSLGALAAQTLLNSTTPISRLRGVLRDYRGMLLMPTFHPAFLLRNPNRKREVWEDMQKVRDRLSEMRREPQKQRLARGSGREPAGA